MVVMRCVSGTASRLWQPVRDQLDSGIMWRAMFRPAEQGVVQFEPIAPLKCRSPLEVPPAVLTARRHGLISADDTSPADTRACEQLDRLCTRNAQGQDVPHCGGSALFAFPVGPCPSVGCASLSVSRRHPPCLLMSFPPCHLLA